ncbi:MAG: tetratricopeptide repeat protein [Candidatus Gastranaerophilales bacterium]|nr:tetratricopeptide repeat protein [Candidatus Gastranaerophilales bacterium]
MDENIEKIELIKKSFELKHTKQYKEALVMLYKALEYDDYNQDNVELLSQIGEMHFMLKNYERALEEFSRALAINPNHTFSLQMCYEIYCKQNQISRALKVAQDMFEHDKNPVSCHCYFDALIKSDKKQDALALFNTLDENIKLDADVLYLISTISDENKRELLLKRIVQLDETNEPANIDMAEIEFKRGNYDEVIKYCLNVDENNPMALYYIGVIEAGKQNYSRAIDLFLNAIKNDNDTHDFYLALAKAYIDNSRFDEALNALKKSINYSLIKEDKTNLDEKYFLSGWILIKQNELSKALLNLGTVDEKSEYYTNAQILIQAINLKKFNLSGAKSTLEKYLETQSDNPFLLDSLAIVYKELKLYKNAIEMLKRALELYPQSNYYKLEIIDLLIDEKRYDEALELINDVREKYPNYACIYNSQTRVYYRLKEYDKALDSISKCIELDNKNSESYYFKGLILNDTEKYQEAKDSIYEAIKLNPSIAKYYNQMARSYQGLKEFDSALLYSKEAIELNQDEINYKKQAYDIAVALGDEKKVQLYKNQLKRSEQILKLSR